MGAFRKEARCSADCLMGLLAPELCQPILFPAGHFSALLPTPGCPIPPALGSPGCPAHLCAAREEGGTQSISSQSKRVNKSVVQTGN